jgi:hypothetical protein
MYSEQIKQVFVFNVFTVYLHIAQEICTKLLAVES